MKYSNYNQNWTFWNDNKEKNKQQVDLPHDAMLAEKRIPDLADGSASAFFPGGKYIYTKQLLGEADYADKCVILEFEGVFMRSTVYLNNIEVGGRIYGYSKFFVDLTDKIIIGQENEIKVIVDNTRIPNSRWYTGSGIYRDVNLLVGEKTHIKPDGVKIITRSCNPAILDIEVEAINADKINIYTEVYDEGTLIASGKGAKCEILIPDAKLWCAETPKLYDVKVILEKAGDIVDEVIERTGIRKLEWNVNQGLLVNGNVVKLKGACVHHDNGPLGACEYDAAAKRRVSILKEVGYNAVRSAHNPISKAMLRACDELGMYIYDETFDQWLSTQSSYDYSIYFEQEWQRDIESMIANDRNRPSVILYGIGNEIGDVGTGYGQKLNKELCDFCHQLDDTRPVTNAVNAMAGLFDNSKKMKKPIHKTSPEDIGNPYERKKSSLASGSLMINMIVTQMPKLLSMVKPEKANKALNVVMKQLDVLGLNYGNHLIEPLHKLSPDVLMLNTETFPKDIAKNWEVVMRNPHMLGDFMWTGWDHLGETGLGVPLYGKFKKQFNKPYPCISSGAGSVDLVGHIDAQGYFASVVWQRYKKPYIGVRPVKHSGEPYFMGVWKGTDAINSWSWNGYDGRKAEIEIYSQGSKVELIQDGKSLGVKPLVEFRADFETVYKAGRLEAVSYDTDGTRIESSVLITAGDETLLSVFPETEILKANGRDLAFINISLVDQAGITKVLEQRKVKVNVEGVGKLQALGSGNPWTEESYLDSTFSTYNGRLLAVVKSGYKKGEIIVTISSEGLETQKLKLTVQ